MPHIVIIDDDPDLRTVMRKILEREGYGVREAEHGLAGLRMIEEDPPALVVTDLLMPEKEGIETIVELREGFPDLPVIAISGAGGLEAEGPLLDAELFGADATLSKPFEVEEFRELVERVLSRDAD